MNGKNRGLTARIVNVKVTIVAKALWPGRHSHRKGGIGPVQEGGFYQV